MKRISTPNAALLLALAVLVAWLVMFAVLQATAVSSAIISATEHKAKVLVFLNQTTTAGVGKAAKQQANQNSLVVTLTRAEGEWDISKLTALG